MAEVQDRHREQARLALPPLKSQMPGGLMVPIPGILEAKHEGYAQALADQEAEFAVAAQIWLDAVADARLNGKPADEANATDAFVLFLTEKFDG